MRWFTPLSILYFALLTMNIAAREAGLDTLAYATKPLLMPVLMLAFWLNGQDNSPKERLYLQLALLFSLAGDVLLMIPDKGLFVFGLVAFLIAHLFFISTYLGKIKAANTGVIERFITYIPFALYVGVFLYKLHPHLAAKPETAVLVVPVAVYATILSLMAYAAFLRRKAVSMQSFLLVFIGAVIFVASDSGIAVSAFISQFSYSHIFIMGTYGVAQYMIVLGLLKGAK